MRGGRGQGQTPSRLIQGAVCVLLTACAPAAQPAAKKPTPSPSASASPAALASSKPAPEPPRPTLRTGALSPVVHPSTLELELLGRVEDAGYELLQLKLPLYGDVVPRSKSPYQDFGEGAWLRVPARLTSDPNAFAFIETAEDLVARRQAYDEAYQKRNGRLKRGQRPEPYAPPAGDNSSCLWLRRPLSKTPLSGVLYAPHQDEVPGRQIPFTVRPGAIKSRPSLKSDWAAAAARFFGRSGDSFYAFAARRVRDRFDPASQRNRAPSPQSWSTPANDLAQLMDTLSGRLSVQQALQRNRPVLIEQMRKPRDVAIQAVEPPRLAHHEWDKMRASLGQKPPEEPLAAATPAEFYYLRSNDVGKLLDVADEVDEWGQPIADVLDQQSQERGTFARYEVELGLKRTGLARLLGPAVVSQLALVGSDPYVHEGSDVTILFASKNAVALQTALTALLGARTLEHGGSTSASFEHDGVSVRVDRSQDGRVHRFAASTRGLELISNSEKAIRRVLSTLARKHPSLADEPDFRYMLARDAGVPADLLGYLGDRFIANVVGPAQKIAEARRQLALSELEVPAYAALLAGWLDGKSPAGVEELVKSGLLRANELAHVDGSKISFTPGSAPASRWGGPEALTPLIDGPEIDRVTSLERDAYRQFAGLYESVWSDRIDPIALRVTLDSDRDKQKLAADLRVLPLLRREYREITDVVGQARVTPPNLASGLRAVFGIGKDAELRQHLEQIGPRLLGRERILFDWLGDYVAVGVADRNELLTLLKGVSRSELELPSAEDESSRFRFGEDKLANFPAYAVIGIRSQGAATLALAAVRQSMREIAPGSGRWDQTASYRGNAIVKVELSREEGFAVYYAVTSRAIAVSLNQATLEGALDQILDQPAWVPPENKVSWSSSGQLVIDAVLKKGSALWTAAAWASASDVFDAGDTNWRAEAIFRGVPELAAQPERSADLMRAYFGSVVLTRDGLRFVAGPDGPHDPARGSAYAPIWPEPPVRGSATARLLGRLLSVRSALSFDEEPRVTPNQRADSLHARLELTLTK